MTTNGRDQRLRRPRALATPVVRATYQWPDGRHNLDAIIALTNSPAWVTIPTDATVGDDFSHFAGSSIAAAISGYADITVPAGYVGPLPLGITFIGGKWDEPTLIGLAYAFEQATQVRTPPQFLPTGRASQRSPSGGQVAPR